MKDRPRALAVLVAVFLVGIIIGVSGSFFWLKPYNEVVIPSDRRRPPPPGMQDPKKLLPELLQMTPEQETQYDKFLSETWEKLGALETDRRSKANEIWSELNSRIKAILNEEQEKKFNEFLKNMEEGREKMRDRRPPPSRRGGGGGPPGEGRSL